MKAALALALGTAIGGALRFLCGQLAVEVLGLAPLWGTAFVNVTGSFVIGLFAALTAADGQLRVSVSTQIFVTVGLCGGFTTFSVLSQETLELLLAGNTTMAGANIALSLALCLVAVWAGSLWGDRLKGAGR